MRLPSKAIIHCGLLSMIFACYASHAQQYVVDRNRQRPAPRVAIQDVCAWPRLVSLGDGTVAAIIFNRPSHADVVGGIDCWISTDHGTTWTFRSHVASPDNKPLSNRVNVACGIASNGDLIVLVGGWQLEREDEGKMSLVKPLRVWVCRSSDHGRSWSVDREGFPAASIEGDHLMPHGTMQSGHDGALRVAAHSLRMGENPRWRYNYVYRSDDDGRNWSDPQPIDAENRRNETFILHAGNGRWLALARHRGLNLYESVDDAKTWRDMGQLTPDQAYPGHLLRLRDGRLLFANGNRAKDDQRAEVRISDDEGLSWSSPRRLVDFCAHDCGYPSSVELPDGRVLTAYYGLKADYHDGYHMGVIVWDPAANLEAVQDGK